MAKRDLYEILELPKGSSVAEVKKAYKRLARKYHPDLNPRDKSAEERFKEISEAHAILSDPEKKKRYDAHGTAGHPLPPGPGVHFEGFDFGRPASGAGGFEDLFETFFHAAQRPRSRRPQPRRGPHLPGPLSLREAFDGKKARLAVRRTRVPCDACNGEGRVAPERGPAPAVLRERDKSGFARGPFSFSSAPATPAAVREGSRGAVPPLRRDGRPWRPRTPWR